MKRNYRYIKPEIKEIVIEPEIIAGSPDPDIPLTPGGNDGSEGTGESKFGSLEW